MSPNDRLSFFDPNEREYIQKPFVEKYVQNGKGSPGEEHEVISVEQAKSGTGYKVETSEFVVFLRNSTELLSYVLEALDVWVNDCDSPSLVVVLTDKRPYYRLAANNQAKRAWTIRKGKYIVIDKSTNASQRDGNPFLTARLTPPLSSTTREEMLPYPGMEEEEPVKKRKRASSEPLPY